MPSDVKVDDITESFRQRILNGDFGAFGRLPSLRLLAEELGTTRETMNKVVQYLQAEGLLISRGTAGVFVNLPRLRIPGVTERFDSFLESQGLTPIMVNVEGPSVMPVSPDLAKMFG